MEKWVGTIIGAVFIVALGYGVYVFFGGQDLSKGGSNGQNGSGLIGRIGDSVERGCSKVMSHIGTINPQHFQGVWAGFVNVIGAIAA